MAEIPKRTFEIIPLAQREKLRQWGIHLGAPVSRVLPSGRYVVPIPSEPHIFFCKKVKIYEGNDNLAKLIEEFDNLMVMHAHGVVLNKSEQGWVWMGTSGPIVKSVKAYEEVARDLGWPQVDVISACRDRDFITSKGAQLLFTYRPDLPYMYSTSTTWHHKVEQLDKILTPAEGVEGFTLESVRWNGVDQWRRVRQARQVNRRIPMWAKMPADTVVKLK